MKRSRKIIINGEPYEGTRPFVRNWEPMVICKLSGILPETTFRTQESVAPLVVEDIESYTRTVFLIRYRG